MPVVRYELRPCHKSHHTTVTHFLFTTLSYSTQCYLWPSLASDRVICPLRYFFLLFSLSQIGSLMAESGLPLQCDTYNATYGNCSTDAIPELVSCPNVVLANKSVDYPAADKFMDPKSFCKELYSLNNSDPIKQLSQVDLGFCGCGVKSPRKSLVEEILISTANDTHPEKNCEDLLEQILQYDLNALTEYNNFADVLSRTDCTPSMVGTDNQCSSCKKVYKTWLCSSNVWYPTFNKATCLSVCQAVELECPYYLPLFPYGGQPTFMCPSEEKVTAGHQKDYTKCIISYHDQEQNQTNQKSPTSSSNAYWRLYCVVISALALNWLFF